MNINTKNSIENYTIEKTQSSISSQRIIKTATNRKAQSLLNGIESAGISDAQNKVIVRAFPLVLPH